VIKKVVLRLAIGLGSILGIVVVIVGGIRLFSDGPIEMLPGGKMSGTVSLESFPEFDNRSNDFIELQVEGWRPSSRTVIGFLHAENLYIPSVQAESKLWPQSVLNKPEVVVRYRGILYPRKASRITDPTLIFQLRKAAAELETVVSTPELFAADTTWFFRLEPIVE
jgi:hypothetical protein